MKEMSCVFRKMSEIIPRTLLRTEISFEHGNIVWETDDRLHSLHYKFIYLYFLKTQFPSTCSLSIYNKNQTYKKDVRRECYTREIFKPHLCSYILQLSKPCPSWKIFTDEQKPHPTTTVRTSPISEDFHTSLHFNDTHCLFRDSNSFET